MQKASPRLPQGHPKVPVSGAEQAEFRARLISAGTWQTRFQLCAALNWSNRKVRAVAQSLGSEVIRCQLGFKLANQITRDDLPAVKQALDAFHSQAVLHETYCQSVRHRLHALTG